MRYFMPDSSEPTGTNSSHVPTGMENDPNADEEVIDQQADEQYPKPADQADALAQPDVAQLPPDKLADSIAYALDGSTSGLTNDTPNVATHKIITEGMTGAGPEDEEEDLRP
ncbi:hypothetical protein IC229_19070 [Spirosoma sp. BT702]|uniref:Uncharacterized protein n=1 Tax=Spirosoma profusum TaxID=2771354 RepID=A0A926XXW3_9BACT|nr:hypothetical protein [Spirosoma profusum]MBD2702757.1 hypothetical protein [Spirosoma profusum]